MNISLKRSHKSFNIFNINVGQISDNRTTQIIEELINIDCPSYVCLLNVHLAVSALRNRQLYEALSHSDYNFPDGMPIVWYAKKLLRMDHVQRVSGIALMEKCFEDLKHYKHFLFGSTEEINNRVKYKAKRLYSGINIVGNYSPPFKPIPIDNENKQQIISFINELSPDIIWVALGAPKQEIFMKEIREKLDHGVMIGVGAAFNYFACDIKRPPLPLRRLGLEWLGRLYKEPRRLFKRYLVTNTLFIIYLIKEIINKKVYR
ncbi:glycosyltransferase [Candidatus Parcubacteria bacterium]|nr:MAG: glycosyltransferase [Candidatus Parcubacteria bacterium]